MYSFKVMAVGLSMLILVSLIVVLAQGSMYLWRRIWLVQEAEKTLDMFEAGLQAGLPSEQIQELDRKSRTAVDKARASSSRIKEWYAFPFNLRIALPDNLSDLWERYWELHQQALNQ